ncbi:MAG TPA: hypothetical protein VE057_24645 [Archangium sp.]|nr:hypothetical protein [Archangium sp.]
MHRAIVEPVLTGKAITIIRRLKDADLPRALFFIALVEDTWPLLPADVQDKLTTCIGSLDPAKFPNVFVLNLDTPGLGAVVREKLTRVGPQGLAALVGQHPRQEFVLLAIDFYAAADSWNTANALARNLIRPLESHFSPQHLDDLMSKVKENPEVTNSFEFKAVMTELRSANIISTTAFDALKQKHGLS